MDNSNTIILGAGPAGLTAAYELMKNGRTSTLLEADTQVGGISQTVEYNGYRFDIGGHRFFSKIDYVNELWHEILPDDFLLRPRLSRIYYRKHFFNYPLKPLNALTGLGLVEAIHICASYAKAKAFPRKPEADFESWMVNRFGYRLYEVFFKTYTEKVWGLSCKEIASDWAAQRINNLSLRQALRDALFGNSKTANGDVVASLIEQFHYPRLGPGMMWQACQDKLAAKDCPTLLQHRVGTIEHENGRVTRVHAASSEGAQTFTGDQFMSSIPLRELILSLSPAAPDKVLQAAKALRYRDYLTVVLIVNKEKVFEDNWIYIHEPDVKMGRIQNYKNWSADMVPDTSRTSLGLEYFLWEKDEEWSYPDEKFIEIGIKECAHLGLINEKDVIDGTVVRMKKAYPVYDDAYTQNLGIIQTYLETFSNLQTLGRNGLHRYNNQDHSMLTGVYAARNILGEEHDVWKVNTDKSYHEETTKGDRITPRKVDVPDEDEILHEMLDVVDPVAMGTALGLFMALGLTAATIILVLKGGHRIGPTLSLLSIYLPGYSVSWSGAAIGSVWASSVGFVGGAAFAWLRNSFMFRYAQHVQRQANRKANRDILDKV